MSQPVLEISNLNAWYGESHVLHGIDLSVAKGEVVCLLGRNGAGRTSTLRAVLGLTGNRTGSIKVNGQEVIGMPTHQVAQLGACAGCMPARAPARAVALGGMGCICLPRFG